eukprot:25748-Chlamydomonas_euryale.AAC.1
MACLRDGDCRVEVRPARGREVVLFSEVCTLNGCCTLKERLNSKGGWRGEGQTYSFFCATSASFAPPVPLLMLRHAKH